jgi:hypothetical protein
MLPGKSGFYPFVKQNFDLLLIPSPKFWCLLCPNIDKAQMKELIQDVIEVFLFALISKVCTNLV